VLDVETNADVAWQNAFLAALNLPVDEELDYGSASTLPRTGIRALLWPASYGKDFGFGDCWQFTDAQDVPGIGTCDASVWVGPQADFDSLFSITPAPTNKDDDMYAFVVQPPAAGKPPTKANEVVVPLPFFRKGLVTFSCDFAPQQLRVMVGGPAGWRHAPTSDPDGEVGIPIGQSAAVGVEFEVGDQVVSVVHRGGNGNDNHPVTILVVPA
jgi:hypothetical protein